MLNMLTKKRNTILIIYAVVLLSLWILTLIFGNSEDKSIVLILSLVIPFVIYGFMRLAYKIVSINASRKVISFFYYFCLVCGSLGMITTIVEFISGFPNGLYPVLGADGAMIIATLDSAKKTFENADKS